MPIAFTKAFIANGKTFATLEEARHHALTELFTDNPRSDVATMVIEQADAIIDILTTTVNSKPSARRINGGTKKRKAKDVTETPALTLAP